MLSCEVKVGGSSMGRACIPPIHVSETATEAQIILIPLNQVTSFNTSTSQFLQLSHRYALVTRWRNVFQSDISVTRNEVASIEVARPITTLNVLGASNSKQITHISFIDKTARSVTSRIELSYSYNMHARGAWGT
jgi:hypothetical protein